MERRFIKSGIPGLDEVAGGGLLDGSIITVSGPTGSGKSTLAAQFLLNGAIKHNEPGLYISIEENRNDFFFHMSGYEWDLTALESERKFILLDYPIHEVDQIINQASSIAEIINTAGVKRVVIDSIMPVALFFHGEEEREKGFLRFIENLRKWGVTVMIISENQKIAGSEANPGSEYGIESVTDGWINLFYRYEEKSMERTRYLEVVKMKGVKHSTKSYPVRIDRLGFSLVGTAPEKAEVQIPKAGTKQLTSTRSQNVPADKGKTLRKPLAASAITEKVEAAKKRLFKRD